MATRLPINPENRQQAEGYCTPKEDKTPQKMSVPSKRVLPIIFLPGIMGSNLRMNADRQAELNRKNNIAWRPDNLTESAGLLNAAPELRQLQLDPATTEVDIYDPVTNPTGDAKETAAMRHDNGRIYVRLNVGIDTPLLMDDHYTKKDRKTKEQKAMERGWGEIYFDSYRHLLEHCEQHLNASYLIDKNTDPWWGRIVGVDPHTWHATAKPPLAPLTLEEFKKAVTDCWFPVHAMGYNWLESNKDSAIKTAARIIKLIDQYQSQGYRCEKVIVVTHSMGGLVARALIHPKMGNIQEKILGMVHGVMPALGAPAAYKRMRCGFEEGLLGAALAPKILGNDGEEVTAVMANSPGCLELLPSEGYGNGWLQIRQHWMLQKSLPQNNDPYNEIYKSPKWYGLLRGRWINPAGQRDSNFSRSCHYLDNARQFHRDIASTYHPLSYAQYGADANRPSWEVIGWVRQPMRSDVALDDLQIVSDDAKGNLEVRSPDPAARRDRPGRIQLGEAFGAGDQTVPMRSADHQLHSGKFAGIFRQTGYEHQESYSNLPALRSTLFSLVKIIQTMKWSCK